MMSLIIALLLIAMALCIFISHERDKARLIKRIEELRRDLKRVGIFG